MNAKQFSDYQKKMRIRNGKEWDKVEGLSLNKDQFNSIIKSNPLSKINRELSEEAIKISPLQELSFNESTSTQDALER